MECRRFGTLESLLLFESTLFIEVCSWSYDCLLLQWFFSLKSFTGWSKVLSLLWHIYFLEAGSLVLAKIVTWARCDPNRFLSGVTLILFKKLSQSLVALKLFSCLAECSSGSGFWDFCFSFSSLDFRLKHTWLFVLVDWEDLCILYFISPRTNLFCSLLLLFLRRKPFKPILWPFNSFWLFNLLGIILSWTHSVSLLSLKHLIRITLLDQFSIPTLFVSKYKLMTWDGRRIWLLLPLELCPLCFLERSCLRMSWLSSRLLPLIASRSKLLTCATLRLFESGYLWFEQSRRLYSSQLKSFKVFLLHLILTQHWLLESFFKVRSDGSIASRTWRLDMNSYQDCSLRSVNFMWTLS